MDRLELPAAGNEPLRQPVEQFGVGRRDTLHAKVIRRGHDAAPKVMQPEPVHDHARQEVPCAIPGVGHPVGQRTAPVAGPPVLWRGFLPGYFFLAAAHQHLKETLRGNILFLVGITALEEMNLLIEVREPTAISVVFGGFEALAGHLHLGHLGLGLGGQVLLHLRIQLRPLAILRAVDFH